MPPRTRDLLREPVDVLRKIATLGVLYFAQGLPFGFQAKALPAILRAEGMSLKGIGLLGLLALPWALKPLWAPLMEGSRWFGQRRQPWIVLCLAVQAAVMVAAGSLDLSTQLTAVLCAVLAMNAIAATMDIAVDGLAVDWLAEEELGYGNAAQVVGYKLGMLTGGGLLIWAAAHLGTAWLFRSMGAATVVALLASLAIRESPPLGGARPSPWEIVRTLFRWMRAPGAGWVLLIVLTYKTGESMSDAMFKPYLVDLKYTVADIGKWVGTVGTIASIAGSLAGGALASRVPLRRALTAAAVVRCLPLAGLAALTLFETPPFTMILTVTIGEHFCGGALTTAMFAYMMSRVDRSIGATHFTALAALEVLGKGLLTWTSGFIAEAHGYGAVFCVATGLSVGFVAVAVYAGRRAATLATAEPRPHTPPAP